jgi:hypothetical protein
MADQLGPHGPNRGPGRGWRLASASLGVAVIGLAVALVLVLLDDDEAQAPTTSAAPTAPTTTIVSTTPAVATTATTALAATTAAPTTTTTSTASSTSSTVATTTTGAPPTTPPPTGDLDVALWPAASGPVGYTDPVALVRDFAEQFVGMPDPDVGPYLAGDSRSGEFEVRAEPGATLVTTVFVRQLGPNDLWWVLGAASPNITVDAPRPLDVVGSPLVLTGSALAFEGTVAVALWEDAAAAPLATTFVTGSGAPPAGPFTGELAYDRPAAEGGALVFTSASGEDGAVLEFAALRVFFA